MSISGPLVDVVSRNKGISIEISSQISKIELMFSELVISVGCKGDVDPVTIVTVWLVSDVASAASLDKESHSFPGTRSLVIA